MPLYHRSNSNMAIACLLAELCPGTDPIEWCSWLNYKDESPLPRFEDILNIVPQGAVEKMSFFKAKEIRDELARMSVPAAALWKEGSAVNENTGEIREFEPGLVLPAGWTEIRPGAVVDLDGQKLVLCGLKGDRFIFRHLRNAPTLREQKFEAQERVRRPTSGLQDLKAKLDHLSDRISNEHETPHGQEPTS